jgi:hypothetical protein
MKFVVFATLATFFMGFVNTQTCDHDREVLCVDDINKGN